MTSTRCSGVCGLGRGRCWDFQGSASGGLSWTADTVAAREDQPSKARSSAAASKKTPPPPESAAA